MLCGVCAYVYSHYHLLGSAFLLSQVLDFSSGLILHLFWSILFTKDLWVKNCSICPNIYLALCLRDSLCWIYNSKWTVTFSPPWHILPTVSWLLLLLIRNQMRGHCSFVGMSFLPDCSWDLFLLCCSFFLLILLGIRCACPVQGFVFPWFLENVQHFSLCILPLPYPSMNLDLFLELSPAILQVSQLHLLNTVVSLYYIIGNIFSFVSSWFSNCLFNPSTDVFSLNDLFIFKSSSSNTLIISWSLFFPLLLIPTPSVCL